MPDSDDHFDPDAELEQLLRQGLRDEVSPQLKSQLYALGDWVDPDAVVAGWTEIAVPVRSTDVRTLEVAIDDGWSISVVVEVGDEVARLDYTINSPAGESIEAVLESATGDERTTSELGAGTENFAPGEMVRFTISLPSGTRRSTPFLRLV